MKRYDAHTKYCLDNGDLVVGVTTVLRVLNKPALVGWANKLGLDGIEVRRYVDELADIGTLTHYFIECDVKGVPRSVEVLKDYTANHKEAAERCFKKYLKWKEDVGFQPIEAELQLVSERYRYGGTLDVYGFRHDKRTLIDFKTGGRIYDEAFTQSAAYDNLAQEKGLDIEDRRIVRIGRSENEGFEDRDVPNIKLHFKKFLFCLDIYNVNKELK